jgi:hypothetical protein
MIETTLPKFRISAYEAIINKISKVAKDLNFTSDIMTFIEQMISLSILSTFDPPLPTGFIIKISKLIC